MGRVLLRGDGASFCDDVERGPKELLEQLLLAREVPVDRPRGDLALPGDVAQVRLRESLVQEFLRGDGEDALPGALGGVGHGTGIPSDNEVISGNRITGPRGDVNEIRRMARIRGRTVRGTGVVYEQTRHVLSRPPSAEPGERTCLVRSYTALVSAPWGRLLGRQQGSEGSGT